jgi:hypothetical protein
MSGAKGFHNPNSEEDILRRKHVDFGAVRVKKLKN